jgi:hypothetical protein
MFCPKCGRENADGARFCNACGQPMPAMAPEASAVVAPPADVAPPVDVAPSLPPGNPPAPPPAKKRSGLWTCLIVALVLGFLFILLLVVVVVAGLWFAAAEPSEPSRLSPMSLPPSSNASTAVDVYANGGTKTESITKHAPAFVGTDNYVRSDATDPAPTSPARAEALEQALRSGDSEAALTLIHPDYRAAYKATILADKSRMTRAAAVLATRRLVSEHDRLAQYEVTDGSLKSFALFEKVDGQWVLLAF